MTTSNNSVDEIQQLQYKPVSNLEADAIHACHDEKFVYIACRDNRVRVWSKDGWKLETVLDETSSLPIRVDVDEEQVYATCDRRVYVWNKQSWGMIGWFDLSYQAITSILSDDKIIVGAKDGRLLSIKKDTNETSSWQLHKTDIISLWKDGESLFTVARKDEARVWTFLVDKAPTEVVKLTTKERPVEVTANDAYLILGLNDGDIFVFDRVDWQHKMTFNIKKESRIAAISCNRNYVIAAYETDMIIIWDIHRNTPVGYLNIEDTEIDWLDVDNDLVYIMSSHGIEAISIIFEGHPLNLSSDDDILYESGIMKSSPYDILEEILSIQQKGDQHLKDGDFKSAVSNYEIALQMLIDNNHTLLEVPTETDRLTTEVNSRLGKALLKSKIGEVEEISKTVTELGESMNQPTENEIDEKSVEQIRDSVTRVLRESRVLAEAQADNVQSYQLSEMCDELASSFEQVELVYQKYRDRINQASSFTSGIMSEWRWLERRRTNLDERKTFLETTIENLQSRIEEAEDNPQVVSIYQISLEGFQKLLAQITRILTASEGEKIDEVLLDSEDAEKAITSMLKILPKKIRELNAIESENEWNAEKERMLEALQQALDTTTKHKLKNLMTEVTESIETVEKLKFQS